MSRINFLSLKKYGRRQPHLLPRQKKDQTVVKYSVLNDSQQLFASRYRLYLPSEEELRVEVERERKFVVRELGERYEVAEA